MKKTHTLTKKNYSNFFIANNSSNCYSIYHQTMNNLLFRGSRKLKQPLVTFNSHINLNSFNILNRPIKLNPEKKILTNYLKVVSITKAIKFKIIGRFYKIKKRKSKTLFLILNYSHKLWLNISKLDRKLFKLKFFKKNTKFTFFVFNNIFSYFLKTFLYNFMKLRNENIYTGRGLKNLSYWKFKRKGKSAAI